MSNDYPLITIVTATYKKFDSLYSSIDSVFKQDYPNIEYIICDDGSGNFPMDEVNKHIGSLRSDNVKNLMILTSETNRGTVKNLNNAYKQSKGTYIVNLSCGDVFFSDNVISKISKVFIDNKCDVVVTSRLMYKDSYEPICLLPHYDEREILNSKYDSAISQYKALILGMYFDMASGSAMHYSRNIMEKYGFFDERFTLWEDGPFLSKFLLEDKLFYAYDIISIWYQTGGMSNVAKGTRNPIYQKDIDLFNEVDRKKHIDLLSNSEKKMLDFSYAKLNLSGSLIKKVIVTIKFFPVSFRYIIYNYIRKKRIRKDLKYIKEILKKD